MTDAPSLAADLAFAQTLADAADAISMARFRANDLHIETKPDRSHVTDADQAVERAIRSLIQAQRPGDAIQGEEYGLEGDSTRRWIIDPIDGTHGFERGIPLWATLIALADGDEVQLGVIAMPALRQRWWASRGAGAWTQDPEATAPRRLHVSGIAELEHASVVFQSISQWDEAGYLDELIALSRTAWRDRGYGDAWSYALLAEGLVEMVGEFGVNPYDVAPAAILVEEAGGRFSSITGEPGPWHGSALASNGVLHPALLQRFAR